MASKLDFRRPHLLRNDAEYEAALAEVEALLLGGKSRVSEIPADWIVNDFFVHSLPGVEPPDRKVALKAASN